LCSVGATAGAAPNPPRVLILPFQINATAERAYLKDEIPRVIGEQLAKDGAVLLSSKAESRLETDQAYGDRRFIQKMANQLEADHVIWGSLTWIGDKFSIDAQMQNMAAPVAPQLYSIEGQGIENLLISVRQLAQDIAAQLFRLQKIVEIRVTGNNRIEADAIIRKMRTRIGDIYRPDELTKELKSIYQMGYFDDVRIEADAKDQGQVVIVTVKEKPTVRRLGFKGNDAYNDDELKEAMSTKVGAVLNLFRIQKDVESIKDLYHEKNYHHASVEYKIHEMENNQARLEFIIEEGDKVMVRKISFVGNTAFADKKLKKYTKTREKGWLSWLTSSGELNQEDLDQDVANLTAFYHNNGYIQARVGEPQVEYKGESIEVTFKIDEGQRFRVGAIDLEGDILISKEALLAKTNIAKEEFYNRETLRKDVLALTDLYSDFGYAYAEIFPRINTDEEKLIVDIVFEMKKGKEVYFEEIIIGGNTRTRDKVIRRQLTVYEQELYSGSRLKQGVRNLHRLDYFEDVQVNTSRGSADDTMILKIDVTEKPTGAFSFGGGYSNVDNIFVTGSISQRNFLGKGQILNLKAHLGGRTTEFRLSFTEPWFLDIPLSLGIDAYAWEFDYDTYVKDSIGTGFRFGYPVWRYTRASIGYNFDITEVKDVDDDAPITIQELTGSNITSSVTLAGDYDSRDRPFLPSEGSRHSLSVEYAGLGGDFNFVRTIGDTGWYFPLFWGTVAFFRAKAGFVVPTGSDEFVPDYEKFYLGGIDSLRGFEWRDIALIDEAGNKRGGDIFVQGNAEFIFPIFKISGLAGVVFYDTGQVYDRDEGIDIGSLRSSAGAGVRWYSPLGPIRLEYGYILDPITGFGEGGRWEFAMGTSF
jgi:outer membrane protein insertion porin family